MKLLEVKHLKKRYGERFVVNDLSFHVDQGEIVGLLGPNGAGKTTAFYMTVGLIRPDSGDVLFKGKNITHAPMHERALGGMGYLAQEPSVFKSLTVEENLLCILQTLKLSKEREEKRLEELLEELHLKTLRHKKAASLSGGERRRLEITRALITNPSCLLLDEPFANIDPLSISDVQSLVRILSKKGISILITDHNAREIFSIATRCYLVQEGRIFYSGTPEQIINNPEVRKNYLGVDFKL